MEKRKSQQGRKKKGGGRKQETRRKGKRENVRARVNLLWEASGKCLHLCRARQNVLLPRGPSLSSRSSHLLQSSACTATTLLKTLFWKTKGTRLLHHLLLLLNIMIIIFFFLLQREVSLCLFIRSRHSPVRYTQQYCSHVRL